MKNLPIDFEIGFADSTIQSYTIKDDNIVLILECWNAQILEITFFNFTSIFAMNYTQISDFQEFFESILLDRTLNELYEKKPENHNFKIFKFLNSDDMTALEIVCEKMHIKKL